MQGFARLWERFTRIQDFGRGFARIHKTLGEDLQGFVRFVRLWERIRKDSQDFGIGSEDSRDFGRGFARIHETLGEDLQALGEDFETLGEDSQG